MFQRGICPEKYQNGRLKNSYHAGGAGDYGGRHLPNYITSIIMTDHLLQIMLSITVRLYFALKFSPNLRLST